MGNKKHRNNKSFGRNDPCWCGSNQKYKYCHLLREEQVAPTTHEMVKDLRRVQAQQYCLHPQALNGECAGGIINAHTVQKKGGLSKIAENGHVYTLDSDFLNLRKTNGRFQMRLTGIRSASTFTGFCGKHDQQTFASFEQGGFIASDRHAFLLGYRALCGEIFAKNVAKDMAIVQRSRDKGRNKTDQYIIQTTLNNLQSGISAAIRYLRDYKASYDQVLLSHDYSNVKYYIIELQNTPDFMCSGVLYPEYDFSGAIVQDTSNPQARYDLITFSIIGTDIGGAIVIAWIGTNASGEQLVRSLHQLSNNDIPNAIARFTFEFFENICISPKWWNNLAPDIKEGLIKRSETDINPSLRRTATCLTDDKIHYVEWIISSRKTNIIK